MKGKEYIRPVSSTWWIERDSWKRYMLRELTAVFVAGYAVFLLVMVYRARDAQSFAAFFEGLRSPLSLVLHLLTLVMVLYHAVTWFNSTPQAMAIWRGEERVSADLIRGSQYVTWILVTIAVAWLALGTGG
jgi:fumarate reductase subunit C